MISIEAHVSAPIQRVWDCYVQPADIVQWTFASDDWHAPRAESDLRPGGRFTTLMAAKDGSFSFEFAGEFTRVEPPHALNYRMDDGRQVEIQFQEAGGLTHVGLQFEPEGENPEEMQREGWQAILDNFRRYVEGRTS